MATNILMAKNTPLPKNMPVPRNISAINEDPEVECGNCHRVQPQSMVFFLTHNKSYECVDEKECRRIAPPPKHVPKNQADWVGFAILDIDMDDLDELPRMRDACVHYVHRITGKKYTQKLFGNKEWSADV